MPYLPARDRKGASPLRLLAIQGRAHANQGSTVCTNVVLVGAELAALSGDALELLLGWRIGIANVDEEALLPNADAVEFVDDFVADIAGLEAASLSVQALSAARQ